MPFLTRYSVVHLTRNNATHAAPGILNITPSPRYHMKMNMKNRLSGDLSDVDSDIKARNRGITFQKHLPSHCQEFKYCGTFSGCNRKEIGEMPYGYNQRMAFGDRMLIENSKGMFISQEYMKPRHVAEYTVVCCSKL